VSETANWQPYRERVIANILAKRTAGGLKPGVYGAEVCQLCGRIRTFAGFITAMALHCGGDFVCWPCRRAITGQSGINSETTALVHERLERQLHRVCWVCCRHVLSGERRRTRHGWACPPCGAKVEADVPEVRDLGRRRYLELTYTTDESLRTVDVLLEAQRLDLEELETAGDARQRLIAVRPARGAQARRRLASVHGDQWPDARDGEPSR
jgi:hypothetical protein